MGIAPFLVASSCEVASLPDTPVDQNAAHLVHMANLTVSRQLSTITCVEEGWLSYLLCREFLG